MNVAISVGAISDAGVVRHDNEDSYLVKPPLFVVADGMGGHAAGEVASRLAIESFSGADLRDTSDPEAIRKAVTDANRLVFETATGSTQGMGTTCALLLLADGTAHVANVGDSRVYRMRAAQLEQISRDHTLAAEMVNQGLITAGQALRDGSSAITRALGGAATVDPDAIALELRSGDRFLLCSDGLSSMVADDGIRQILIESNEPQDAAQKLVDAAKAAGGDDNVTVIVVNVDLPIAPDTSSPDTSGHGASVVPLAQVSAPAAVASHGRASSLLLLIAVVVAVLVVAVAVIKFL